MTLTSIIFASPKIWIMGLGRFFSLGFKRAFNLAINAPLDEGDFLMGHKNRKNAMVKKNLK